MIIASDRDQSAGANGIFNTIGVGDGFHAKDITFGNYCNVDLIYERDPSQNHPMRQGAIVQAQVITKAVISWYRNDVIGATTTFVNDGAVPDAAHELTAEDVGAVFKAVIEPQYNHSQKGEGVAVTLIAPITAEDVKANADIKNINLSTLVYTVVENASAEEDFAWDAAYFQSGYWYGGF